MVEPPCEFSNTCTTDMLAFKGFFHRWYSVIAQLVPDMGPKILPKLKDSAQAAIQQCTGGALGRQCGFKWATGSYDGKTGASQEMAVLSAVMSLLTPDSKTPLTEKTGGTSKGDPNAGGSGGGGMKKPKPITGADKAGAGIMTALLMASACGLFGFMSIGK